MVEKVHVGVDVQGETVHGDPLGNPYPDGGYLALIGPDPGVAGRSPGLHPEVRQGTDQHLFHRPNIGDNLFQVGQGQDGISDQLSGAVVGDIPSPVDVISLRAYFAHPVVADEQVGSVSVTPHRVDVGVFLKEQVVGFGPTVTAALPYGPLQIPGLLVGETAQPSGAQPGRVGYHPVGPIGF